jgi:hypothetical protein
MLLKAREIFSRLKFALREARGVGQLFTTVWRRGFCAHALAYLA